MKTKKNRFNNLLKRGVFLFGISLLLWNCEKDNQIQEEGLLKPRFKISLISKTEITENKKLTNRLSEFSNSKNNFAKEVHSSEHNFTVDTNLAKYIENNDGSYHSYTFKVIRDQNNGLLENILASLQLDGTYKLFLIKYELSEEGTSIESTNKVQVEIIEDAEFSENLFSKSNCHLEFKCVETCSYGYCHTDSECDDLGALYEVTLVCSPGGGDNGTGAGDPVDNPDDTNEDSGNGGGTGNGGSGVGDNDQFPDTTSPLTCNDGYELYNENCVPICGRNSTRDINNGSCECDEGYKFDNNGDCVVDDQIINLLTGKALCVYNKLKTSSTGFKNAIKKFDGEFPVAHLKFVMEDLGNTRAETRAPDGDGNSPDYVITIAINSNSNIHGVGYRPNLMTAKTIAHEVIHAEMFRKLLSLAKQGNLSFTGWSVQQQKDYIISIKDNFPGLYDYYTRYDFNTSTPNNAQHQAMATHYRKILARILQELDTGNAVPDNQQPQQLYMDIAWEGLRYSNIHTWNSLQQPEKDRVNNVISNYILNNKSETCTE